MAKNHGFDVTAVIPDLLPEIASWKFDGEMEVCSDHLPIVKVISGVSFRLNVRRVRDCKKVERKVLTTNSFGGWNDFLSPSCELRRM